ncbi:hypothetical protein OA238_c26300 [Octadecabacter arcticus 238]|uniref:NrS-1 polymerase-like helicase domain-containing protein n=1 Tax=Octadecabacter arcticus 238 TaxID=391616 RepID=M9RS75_9RHOB|nr:primase-helicase family protein [Octadecabacter arcticus]AGI72675.1 hypothetical protein OA238_c26300 [Octadecabacter arcticus 238]
MTKKNNTYTDDTPYSHLSDGMSLAFDRLDNKFGKQLDGDTIKALSEKTYLQSDGNGRSVIRHDTGHRTVTTTPLEVEQSLLSAYEMSFGWQDNLLAIPHPVYAPNRPIWLKDDKSLFRNTWRKAEVLFTVPEIPEDGSVVSKPPEWAAFLQRVFHGELASDLSAVQEDPTNEFLLDGIANRTPDRERFIKEFELWLAFSLFSDQRPMWGPVLRGGHGTGKGTIANQILKPFAGASNYVQILPHNLKGDHAAQLLTERLMIVFDEVNDRGQVFYDRLKNMTTEPTLAVNPKHLAPYTDEPVFSVVVLSNEEVPMSYPEGERRWLVSPYMVHEVDGEDTAGWLYDTFVPWLRDGGYSEVGQYLKYLVATEDLPAQAWKSPWFYETCKTDANEDHTTAILTWLGQQNENQGYTISGLSSHFKAGSGVVKKCLADCGYKRGKTNGTNINVMKKKGKTGQLHPICSKTD